MKILNKNNNLSNKTIDKPIDNTIIKKRGRKTTNKLVDKNNICIYDNSTLLSNNYLAYLPILNEDIVKIENKEYITTSNINSEIYDTKNNININNDKNIDKDIISLNVNNKLDSVIVNNIYIKSQNIDYNNINNNINCWWCTLLIEGKIFGIPEYFKLIDNQYYFYVNGYYCSLNCSLAHCIELNDNKMWEKISIIYMMRDIIFNINNIDIKDIEIIQSKSKYVLQIYGGNESIEEYKKNILLISKDNNYICTIYNYNNIENKNKINNSEYNLKRSKPLNNNILYNLLFNKNKK